MRKSTGANLVRRLYKLVVIGATAGSLGLANVASAHAASNVPGFYDAGLGVNCGTMVAASIDPSQMGDVVNAPRVYAANVTPGLGNDTEYVFVRIHKWVVTVDPTVPYMPAGYKDFGWATAKDNQPALFKSQDLAFSQAWLTTEPAVQFSLEIWWSYDGRTAAGYVHVWEQALC